MAIPTTRGNLRPGFTPHPLRADPADWAAALAAHNAPNPQSSDDGLTLVIADPADAAAESAGAA